MRASLSVVLCVALGALFVTGCSELRAVRAVLDASPDEGAVPLRVEFHTSGSMYGASGPGTFALDFDDGTSLVQGDEFGVLIPHVYEHAEEYTARA